MSKETSKPPAAAKDLAAKYADKIQDLYSLNYRVHEDQDVVDKDGCFVVHAENPPYSDYTASYVKDIVKTLTKCGFERHCVSHVTRTMRCGKVEARIENVDADPEEGDPILVEFWDVDENV